MLSVDIAAILIAAPTIILIMLKLTGLISWGWIWVLVPLWGSVGFFVVAAIFLWFIFTH